MDVISIGAAFESFKTIKTLLGMAVDAQVDAQARSKILDAQVKVGEIQNALLELQERLFACQEEQKRLRDQLAAERNWTGTAAEYELTETP